MTTLLHGPLKRELNLQGEPFTLTITPHGLTLVPKGRRNGYELDWLSLISGDAALASALRASVLKPPKPSTRGKTANATRAGGASNKRRRAAK
jgi:hypothetical protein